MTDLHPLYACGEGSSKALVGGPGLITDFRDQFAWGETLGKN